MIIISYIAYRRAHVVWTDIPVSNGDWKEEPMKSVLIATSLLVAFMGAAQAAPIANPVPEPGTGVLVIVALVAMIWVSRRRKMVVWECTTSLCSHRQWGGLGRSGRSFIRPPFLNIKIKKEVEYFLQYTSLYIEENCSSPKKNCRHFDIIWSAYLCVRWMIEKERLNEAKTEQWEWRGARRAKPKATTCHIQREWDILLAVSFSKMSRISPFGYTDYLADSKWRRYFVILGEDLSLWGAIQETDSRSDNDKEKRIGKDPELQKLQDDKMQWVQ